MATRKSNKKQEVVVEQEVIEVVEETTEVVTEVAEVETPAENEAKADVILSIEEVVKLYSEAGIKCYNPTAKGNYRIMGNQKGSSLNIKSTKGYYIYTSEDDYTKIVESGITADDLIIEKGTNAQDSKRPNTIICKTVETLKALLALYALNPLNKVPAEPVEE